MPKIEKVFYLEVTPERFLECCSREELIEIDLLLSSSRFQSKIRCDIKQQNYETGNCKILW
jgi:hypothetical protein